MMIERFRKEELMDRNRNKIMRSHPVEGFEKRRKRKQKLGQRFFATYVTISHTSLHKDSDAHFLEIEPIVSFR